MQIENLTQEQVEMLDYMWNELDSEEEFVEWYDCLDEDQQRMADVLQSMLILESIDDDMIFDNETDLAEAKAVLSKFRI